MAEFPGGGDRENAESLHSWLVARYGEVTANSFKGWNANELLGATEVDVKAMVNEQIGLGPRLYGALNTIKNAQCKCSLPPSVSQLACTFYLSFRHILCPNSLTFVYAHHNYLYIVYLLFIHVVCSSVFSL